MNKHFSNVGISALREASPLCSKDYAGALHQLRPVIPPWWMKAALWLSLAAVVLSTAVVLFSNMDEYVSAPGEVRPEKFELVYSRANGLLASVHISDRDHVTKGQVLARLDPWEANQKSAILEGEIIQARAELDLAQATTRKITASESVSKGSQQASTLIAGGYGQAVKDEASAREKLAFSSLTALETKQSLLLEESSRLDVIAPNTGIIISKTQRLPGEKILAGETLFKITPNEISELRLRATEDRVNLIQPGQVVRFRANNNPDRLAPFATGRVTEVALDRDLSDSTKGPTQPSTYRVSVGIETIPYPLALGATVNAEIIISRRPFWRLLFLKAAQK